MSVDTAPLSGRQTERLLWGTLGAVAGLAIGLRGIMRWPTTKAIVRPPSREKVSTYDGMTGLPTERLFLVLLTHALERARGAGRLVVVLVIQLDTYDASTNSARLAAHPLTIRVQAARIKGALSTQDAVARLGRHRFAVMVESLDDAAHAEAVAQHIERAMSLPLVVEGEELLLSSRIGVAVAPRDAAEATELLRAALRALPKSQSDDESIKFMSPPHSPLPNAAAIRTSVPASRHAPSAFSGFR